MIFFLIGQKIQNSRFSGRLLICQTTSSYWTHVSCNLKRLKWPDPYLWPWLLIWQLDNFFYALKPCCCCSVKSLAPKRLGHFEPFTIQHKYLTIMLSGPSRIICKYADTVSKKVGRVDVRDKRLQLLFERVTSRELQGNVGRYKTKGQKN